MCMYVNTVATKGIEPNLRISVLWGDSCDSNTVQQSAMPGKSYQQQGWGWEVNHTNSNDNGAQDQRKAAVFLKAKHTSKERMSVLPLSQ